MKRTGNFIAAGLIFGLVVALQSGCAAPSTVTQPVAQTAPLQPEAAKPPVTMTKPETPPLEGKVVETMNAGSYTYIFLEKDGKKGWVAVPFTEVAVGQEIKVKPGLEMGLFSSKSLNRSFDNIIFSSGLVTDANSESTQGKPAAEPTVNLPAGHPVTGNKTKPKGMAAMMSGSAAGGEMAGSLSGKVVETMNAGGYTYISLEKEGKQTWVAVPNMVVTVGDEMELQPGAVMKNFTSKSLNKTFDTVVFSGGPVHSK
jgi:hypothetical protein